MCRSVPEHVRFPPVEAVVFGWGVAEDGQLVSWKLHAVGIDGPVM